VKRSSTETHNIANSKALHTAAFAIAMTSFTLNGLHARAASVMPSDYRLTTAADKFDYTWQSAVAARNSRRECCCRLNESSSGASCPACASSLPGQLSRQHKNRDRRPQQHQSRYGHDRPQHRLQPFQSISTSDRRNIMTNRFDPDLFSATDMRIALNEIFPEATYGANQSSTSTTHWRHISHPTMVH